MLFTFIKEFLIINFCALSVIRGEKARRIYSALVQKHRAAIVLQKHVKSRITRKHYMNIRNASVVIQSGNDLYHLLLFIK